MIRHRQVDSSARTGKATAGGALRALTCALMVVLGASIGDVRSAEASCGAIHVSVPLLLLPGHVIPVSWSVDPSCAVVETGLLLGRSPDALAPVGQPIHASREHYEQDLIVETGGEYWIAAYARDEGGQVIQSSPHVVFLPMPPSFNAHGSHGAPPSYTGDDQDFLRPAGKPHHASLHSATLTQRSVRVVDEPLFPHLSERVVAEERIIASTDRHVVETHQAQPFVIEGQVVPVDSALYANNSIALRERFNAPDFLVQGYILSYAEVLLSSGLMGR